VPKNHQSRSQLSSPDPAWDIEFEQVIRRLPPPHHLALLNDLRHRHLSTRLFINVTDTGNLQWE
jgi:hypothetical protein